MSMIGESGGVEMREWCKLHAFALGAVNFKMLMLSLMVSYVWVAASAGRAAASRAAAAAVAKFSP